MRLMKALAVLVVVSTLVGCDKDQTTDADAQKYAQEKILESIKQQAPSYKDACEVGRSYVASVKELEQKLGKKLGKSTSELEWATASCRERIDPAGGVNLSEVIVSRHKDGSIKSICSNVIGKNYDNNDLTVPAIVNEDGVAIQFEDSFFKESKPDEYKSLQEAFTAISNTYCK